MIFTVALAALLMAPDVDTTVAVQHGQRLQVSAHSAAITIRGWPRSSVRLKTGNDEGAPRLELSSGAVVVQGDTRRGTPSDADIELTIPSWMAVSVDGVDGDIHIDGIDAPISAETVQGSIAVHGGQGVIVLHSVEGTVTLSGARGRIDVASINADVRVTDVDGDIAAETVNGGIDLLRVTSGNAEANTVNGDISYSGPIRDGGRYHLATHNGDVTIGLAPTASAQVSVSTFQGEFQSDFPVTLRDRLGKRFGFTLGGGGARVDLDSFQGTIRLARPGSFEKKSSSDR